MYIHIIRAYISSSTTPSALMNAHPYIYIKCSHKSGSYIWRGHRGNRARTSVRERSTTTTTRLFTRRLTSKRSKYYTYGDIFFCNQRHDSLAWFFFFRRTTCDVKCVCVRYSLLRLGLLFFLNVNKFFWRVSTINMNLLHIISQSVCVNCIFGIWGVYSFKLIIAYWALIMTNRGITHREQMEFNYGVCVGVIGAINNLGARESIY